MQALFVFLQHAAIANKLPFSTTIKPARIIAQADVPAKTHAQRLHLDAGKARASNLPQYTSAHHTAA
jgi:hypothetical protein